jgi:hypothetical protein
MQTRKLFITTASMALAAILTQPANAASRIDNHAHSRASVVLAAMTADQTKLNATKAVLRDLWIDHVFWSVMSWSRGSPMMQSPSRRLKSRLSPMRSRSPPRSSPSTAPRPRSSCSNCYPVIMARSKSIWMRQSPRTTASSPRRPRSC